MAAEPDNAVKNAVGDVRITEETHPDSNKIDRNAPAGSENSLGAQSVRDGRPSTGDGVVEAIDEVTPDLNNPLVTDNRPK
jgi:hypothetical protein